VTGTPIDALTAAGSAPTFDQASALVIEYLRTAVPLGFWSVTRFDGQRQLYLSVADSVYGKSPGGSHAWSDSMCQFMVTGSAPSIAPDVEDVPAYATAGVRDDIPIGAYVGLPLTRADGEVFGTLCGLDPEAQSPDLLQHSALLELLARLLSAILQADLMNTQAERRAERLAAESETDELTGLYNRRGWSRILEAEERRYLRFGDTGSVIILDIDRLKQINDLQGHHAGDRHLQKAAAVLRATTRASDVLARLGGDEFGILVATTDSEQTQQLVDRLQQQLEHAGTPTSVGHAPYTAVSGFPGAWQKADEAMYRQKATRRRNASTTDDLPR
jgi:diguanylate cyclase